MEIRLVLNGLDCANCANKIETKVNKINGVKVRLTAREARTLKKAA